MTDNSMLITNAIARAVTQVKEEIKKRFPGVNPDALTVRRARSEDFDGLGQRNYVHNFAAAGEQTTAAQRFYMETNASRYFAILFVGWDLGTLEGNLDYIRIENGTTTVREWAGAGIRTSPEGPWLVDDPVYAMKDEQFRLIPSLLEADATCRTFPIAYLWETPGS